MNDLSELKSSSVNSSVNSSDPMEPDEFNKPLYPVPVPDMANLTEMPLDLKAHLSVQEPIDDFPALSLHVAQVTMTVSDLDQRMEALEQWAIQLSLQTRGKA